MIPLYWTTLPRITEINAGRFGTTIHFYTEAGCNFPYLLVQLAFGEQPAGIVPQWAGVLLATADTQKHGGWFVVRAWGRGYRSRRIMHGRWEDFDELERTIFDTRYDIEGDHNELDVTSYLMIDSGGGKIGEEDSTITDLVYRFAQRRPAQILPIKGHGGRQRARKPVVVSHITYTPPGTKHSPYNVTLRILDTGYYKDLLAGRIAEGMDDEDAVELWQLSDDDDEEYNRQMSSERKVIVRKGMTAAAVWKPLSPDTPNHYWDCETYQGAAADIAQVEYLPPEEDLIRGREAAAKLREQPRRERPKKYGRPGGRSWIPKGR